jgi:uncharacterized protein (TIGR02118 family)
MVKFVAIYKQPADKDAFDKHFDEVHTPLCDQVPNLLGMGKLASAFRGFGKTGVEAGKEAI